MISQIASVKSSFPSAFAALGVGSVASLGNLLLLKRWPPETFGIAHRSSVSFEPNLAVALPYFLGFVAFFFVYAIGFTLIGIGARLRVSEPTKEASRVSGFLGSGNEALIKYFFEQRAVVDVFDGLSVALPLLFLSASLAFYSFAGFVISLGVAIFGVSCYWAFRRDSNKRIGELDKILHLIARDPRDAG